MSTPNPAAWAGVPTKRTRQPVGDLSTSTSGSQKWEKPSPSKSPEKKDEATWSNYIHSFHFPFKVLTCAPLFCRISAICCPLVPITWAVPPSWEGKCHWQPGSRALPVACLGSSMCSSTEGLRVRTNFAASKPIRRNHHSQLIENCTSNLNLQMPLQRLPDVLSDPSFVLEAFPHWTASNITCRTLGSTQQQLLLPQLQQLARVHFQSMRHKNHSFLSFLSLFSVSASVLGRHCAVRCFEAKAISHSDWQVLKVHKTGLKFSSQTLSSNQSSQPGSACACPKTTSYFSPSLPTSLASPDRQHWVYAQEQNSNTRAAYSAHVAFLAHFEGKSEVGSALRVLQVRTLWFCIASFKLWQVLHGRL